MLSTNFRISAFRKIVWSHYQKYGRHTLPWRHTQNPYRILVSEVMLQQTQVERVIPYYKVFLKKFPTVHALSHAPLSEVLKAWQGLGYNRRAKNLHNAVKAVKGVFPNTIEALEALPGVGSYTARAIVAFAYNQDVVFVETNIRTAVIHLFFPKRNTTIYGCISDREIEEVLKKVLPKGWAREWYSALMDYGAHLKGTGIRVNAKSKHYTKQSKFKGSDREARGAILRALAKGTQPSPAMLGKTRTKQVGTQLEKLLVEGFIEKPEQRYRLAR